MVVGVEPIKVRQAAAPVRVEALVDIPKIYAAWYRRKPSRLLLALVELEVRRETMRVATDRQRRSSIVAVRRSPVTLARAVVVSQRVLR